MKVRTRIQYYIQIYPIVLYKRATSNNEAYPLLHAGVAHAAQEARQAQVAAEQEAEEYRSQAMEWKVKYMKEREKLMQLREELSQVANHASHEAKHGAHICSERMG